MKDVQGSGRAERDKGWMDLGGNRCGGGGCHH